MMSGDRATDFKWISQSIPAQVYTSSSNQSEIASKVYKIL